MRGCGWRCERVPACLSRDRVRNLEPLEQKDLWRFVAGQAVERCQTHGQVEQDSLKKS